MKTELFESTVKTAFGRDISDAPVELSVKASVYESYDEIPADKLPSQDDVLKIVNSKIGTAALAAAKAKEFSARLEAGDQRFKAPSLEDEDVAVRTIAKALRAQNPDLSAEDSVTAARAALGKA